MSSGMNKTRRASQKKRGVRKGGVEGARGDTVQRRGGRGIRD